MQGLLLLCTCRCGRHAQPKHASGVQTACPAPLHAHTAALGSKLHGRLPRTQAGAPGRPLQQNTPAQPTRPGGSSSRGLLPTRRLGRGSSTGALAAAPPAHAAEASPAIIAFEAELASPPLRLRAAAGAPAALGGGFLRRRALCSRSARRQLRLWWWEGGASRR